MELENDVEGHIKWLQELATHVPGKETLKSHCTKLLKSSGIIPGSSGMDWKEWSMILSNKLNTTAMSILSGNTEKSLSLLEQLDRLLEKTWREATANQLSMFQYCRDVLRWKNLDGDMNGVEAKRLQWKWTVLKCDGGNEMVATVCFLKGSLALELGVDMEEVQKYYLEATELDPDCVAWYNHAYLLAREIRFKHKSRSGRRAPGLLERSLADKAYKLCEGENLLAAVNWGIMNKEVWMKKNGCFWVENLATYVKIVEHLEHALTFAQGSWVMKIKTNLAEFLYFGKGPKEDKLRGRKMLLELGRKYLYNLTVLYLVGKMHFVEGDLEGARKCYERALKVDPTGGPCLSDYLNLLKGNHRSGDLEEMVRLLKNALSLKNTEADTKNFFRKQLDFAEKKIQNLMKLEMLMNVL